jgi:hypothetical protein
LGLISLDDVTAIFGCKTTNRSMQKYIYLQFHLPKKPADGPIFATCDTTHVLVLRASSGDEALSWVETFIMAKQSSTAARGLFDDTPTSYDPNDDTDSGDDSDEDSSRAPVDAFAKAVCFVELRNIAKLMRTGDNAIPVSSHGRFNGKRLGKWLLTYGNAYNRKQAGMQSYSLSLSLSLSLSPSRVYVSDY